MYVCAPIANYTRHPASRVPIYAAKRLLTESTRKPAKDRETQKFCCQENAWFRPSTTMYKKDVDTECR